MGTGSPKSFTAKQANKMRVGWVNANRFKTSTIKVDFAAHFSDIHLHASATVYFISILSFLSPTSFFFSLKLDFAVLDA